MVVVVVVVVVYNSTFPISKALYDRFKFKIIILVNIMDINYNINSSINTSNTYFLKSNYCF